jgi:putative transcriptional regulator
MKDEMFQELMESVRQGAAILRGDAEPSRKFEFAEPDVKRIRESFDLSQPKFAAMLGISVGTLRNWEQGRRRPEGPARVLLRVAARYPEAVLDTVASESARPSGRSRSRKEPAAPTVIEPLR